jgi:hypothetical protein
VICLSLPPRRFLTDRRQQVVARLLAAAAAFGAKAAVLMVGGVPLTLLATGAAGQRASFDRCDDDAEIGRGLAGHDATGCLAHIGAIEVEANAADQLLHVAFAETGVGAARARSGTVETLVDTTQERVEIKAGRLWMRLDDFSNRHVLSSSFERRWTAFDGISYRGF